MSRKDLKNKPLVEAILEVRWNLPASKPPVMEADQHYQLLLGRFSERIQAEFPHHEPLPTVQIPATLVAYMPQHRFRHAENGWPLIQLGPGIMTVNETDGYTWSNFEPRCINAVAQLFDAYPVKQKPSIKELALRYIDAVEVDFATENIFDFLREKMKIHIALPENLFATAGVKKAPSSFQWQTSFSQEVPGGLATLRFAVGERKGRPSLIWEILVQTRGDQLAGFPDTFSAWLKKAHDLTDDWFFKLIEGDLERRFSGD